MSWVLDGRKWAERVFGGSELGDPRRVRRLVAYAAMQAEAGARSPLAACKGDAAAAEGAYRLLRNPKVEPDAIAEGGFAASAEEAKKRDLIVAIEDTTTLSYGHSAAESLGDLGGKAGSTKRGMFVHSVLLVDADRRDSIGLVEQERWIREPGKRGQRHRRRERDYRDKESFKWQRASERVSRRLGDTMERVISVCDREADVYEYLHYKREEGQRFLIRAAWNRTLVSSTQHLREKVRRCPVIGHRVVDLPQYGGRKARTAKLSVRTTSVALSCPRRARGTLPPIEVTAILVVESRAPSNVEPLEWMLLTSEPAHTASEIERLVDLYALRWRIEEFHKAWKSGAGVEKRRMVDAENLERIAVILAFIAVRLLQLRELVSDHPEKPCTEVLSPIEWKCLWASTEKKRPPTTAPPVRWAYHAVGKLGGWIDTKRTGRVGWQTLWEGWQRLEDRVDALIAARQFLGGTDLPRL